MKRIYETVVYDGATKVWRIWNITTATVYSGHFDTEAEAYADIEDGEERAGAIVTRVPRTTIIELLAGNQ